MPELGPAARLLIDALAAAHMVRNPDAAVQAVRALIGGARLRDFVDPAGRAECDALVTALRARARTAFAAWAARHDAPEAEVTRGLDLFEHGAQGRIAMALPQWRARDDAEATVMALVLDSVATDPSLTDDVIARDVARAFIKVAVAAARDYASALARLPTCQVTPPTHA